MFPGGSSYTGVKHDETYSIVVEIALGHFLWEPKIFPRSYSYLGAFEVPIGAFELRYFLPFTYGRSRLRLFAWALVIVGWPYLSYLGIIGVLTEVILWVSWTGRGRTAQSLYALKLRATIIGYVPPLVVYVSLKTLLCETYLLHSGAHLSNPSLEEISTQNGPFNFSPKFHVIMH